MMIGKINVEFTMDTKQVISMLDEISEILKPYNLSDKDIKRVGDLLKSGMKATERKEIDK